MRESGIHARHQRRYKVATDAKHGLLVAGNLPARDFTLTAPNPVAASNITYLWTDEDRLYRAIVLDLFNREIAGGSLKPRMTTDILTDGLTMAWFRKQPAPNLMHHSDWASQYASQAFRDKLTAYGMICLMTRKGNCRDSPPTARWFNGLKDERVHGVRYITRPEMNPAAFEYIAVFCNRKRQHPTLGYRSSAEFLEHWIRAQHQTKRVGWNPPFARPKTEGNSFSPSTGSTYSYRVRSSVVVARPASRNDF